MYLKYACALVPVALVDSHAFVGQPEPFRWDLQVEKLIMPMNGDPNYRGSEWGQQPFPCKGHHRGSIPLEPQTFWHAGSRVTFQMYDSTNTTGASMHDPGAAHSGGSCQASFSYDNGETWIVVQSWEGNCLRVRKGHEGTLTNSYDIDQNYSFDIPDFFPGADSVIFAWTWLNASGNREFYMSCSPVRLVAAHSSTNSSLGYPMYIANLQANPETVDAQHKNWSRCHIPQNVWIRYPQRYKGINPPIIADSLRENSQIQYFEIEDDGGVCGSDNKERTEGLGLRSGSDNRESIALSYTSQLGTSENQYQNSQFLPTISYRATQTVASPSQPDVLWAVPSTKRSNWAT